MCDAVQFSDQMVCDGCGLVWDMNDPDPPLCRKVDGEMLMKKIEFSKRRSDQIIWLVSAVNAIRTRGDDAYATFTVQFTSDGLRYAFYTPLLSHRVYPEAEFNVLKQYLTDIIEGTEASVLKRDLLAREKSLAHEIRIRQNELDAVTHRLEQLDVPD